LPKDQNRNELKEPERKEVVMNKTWLVTGCSRGLGRAIAEEILEAGHNLVAAARRSDELESLKERFGDRVVLFDLDVTDDGAANVAVRKTVAVFGRLDVLVNNAGYGDVAPIEDFDMSSFRKQMETNFFGTVHLTRAALPVMRQQRSGHIIQISSIGGRVGAPGLGAYQASKFAVEGFSEALNYEVSPLGIKVTIVEPGAFRTDWAGSSMSIATIREEYAQSVGMLADHVRASSGKQIGDPRKAARVLLKLITLENPPLHLLLGSDAFGSAEGAAKRLAESDAKWKSLTFSTDFEDELAKSAPKWKR
jgi:NAD(P)-dependent dehydrogenase (short-subunit alcohol dehydrogenase family)